MTKPPYPIGSTVLTPLWRLAIVESYSRDGKANLRYVGIDASDVVSLRPSLLRPPPDRQEME